MSLRVKLFITYAVVVIVTLSLAVFGSGLLLKDYAERLALKSLEDTARPINVQMAAMVRGDATPLELLGTLQEQASSNDVYLLFLDATGAVLQQISPDGNEIDLDSVTTLPLDTQRIGRGILTGPDSTLLYVVYPLARIPKNLVKVEGIAVVTESPGVAGAIAGLLKPFILAGLIALLGSLLLAWRLSRSVSKPVADIIQAAGHIASGEYEYRIKSDARDELGKLAQSFDAMAGEIESARSRLRHFVADVTHELKSPLTAIQGFTQALSDGTAQNDTARDKAIRIIGEEARRMRRQVDELLDLSRLQSGKLSLRFEKIDLHDVLMHSSELFALPAGEKSVTIKLESRTGLFICGDADRLEQVFNNLLDNAVKNTPPFGEIRLGSRIDDGSIEIRVADEGPGIHPDNLKSVFDRFYQLTGVRTGVGLGLAISREIVLAHGGEIGAVSEPGTGACFVVKLPRVQ